MDEHDNNWCKKYGYGGHDENEICLHDGKKCDSRWYKLTDDSVICRLMT